jgi:DNA integrity scanning protein DisA with diadenylate cyclase activity
MTVASGDPLKAIEERRLRRLEEELRDERVRLPLDGPDGRRLLAELAYARRPLHHESRIPGYGALVFAGVPDWDACPQVPLLVPAPDVPAEVLRRYADGRSSFVVVTPDGIAGLATFEHSVEDEGAAVRMQRSGAVVVQRTRRGAVRVCAGHGVVLWNGSRWMFKPRAEDYVRALRRLAPHADSAVLTGLLELAVHSLASARVGATFVWNLDGRPANDPRDGLLELGRAITGPPLSVARRGHFPALVSVESQVDLATVVAADGSVGPIGVRLDHSPAAGAVVPPTGGARHTSARRFTFDVREVLAVVVSESGRVTVFSGGAVAAEISPDQPGGGSGGESGEELSTADSETLTCGHCQQPLLVLAAAAGPRPDASAGACPVCGTPIALAAGRIILGVPVRPG